MLGLITRRKMTEHHVRISSHSDYQWKKYWKFYTVRYNEGIPTNDCFGGFEVPLLIHRERVTIVISSSPEKLEELVGPAGAEWVTKRERAEVMQDYLRKSKA